MSLEQEIRQVHALMTEDDAHFLRLSRTLNELILHDFDSVVRALYRIDVSEKKVRAAIATADADAGTVIARLILEREKEKAASRAKYRMKDDDIPEDERW